MPHITGLPTELLQQILLQASSAHALLLVAPTIHADHDSGGVLSAARIAPRQSELAVLLLKFICNVRCGLVDVAEKECCVSVWTRHSLPGEEHLIRGL